LSYTRVAALLCGEEAAVVGAAFGGLAPATGTGGWSTCRSFLRALVAAF